MKNKLNSLAILFLGFLLLGFNCVTASANAEFPNKKLTVSLPNSTAKLSEETSSKKIILSPRALIKNGTLYIPVEWLTKYFSFSADYSVHKLTLTKNTETYHFVIGSTLADINYTLVELQNAPLIKKNKAYLPWDCIKNIVSLESTRNVVEKKIILSEKPFTLIPKKVQDPTLLQKPDATFRFPIPSQQTDIHTITSESEMLEKLTIAIILKKKSSTFSFSNVDLAKQVFSKLKTWNEQINFERAINQSAIATVACKATFGKPFSKLSIDFDYRFLKYSDFMKIRNEKDLDTVIRNVLLTKTPEISLAIQNGASKSMILENILQRYILQIKQKGYLVEIENISDRWSFGNVSLAHYTFVYPPHLNSISYSSKETLFTEILLPQLFSQKATILLPIALEEKDISILQTSMLEINRKYLVPNGYYCDFTSYAKSKTYSSLQANYTKIDHVKRLDAKGNRISLDEKDIYQLILELLMEGSESVTWIDFSSADYVSIATLVTEHHPEFSYVESFLMKSSGNKITLTPKYRFKKEYLSAMKDATLQKANKIIANVIHPSMSERDKVKAIHDYIISNARYETEHLDTKQFSEESYTAYGILNLGVGVCQGYAAAFSKLAKMAGLKTLGIAGTSKDQPHAWNLVILNNTPYYVDLTWDDPITNDGTQVLRYDYFLVDENTLRQDHTWNAKDFDIRYLAFHP